MKAGPGRRIIAMPMASTVLPTTNIMIRLKRFIACHDSLGPVGQTVRIEVVVATSEGLYCGVRDGTTGKEKGTAHDTNSPRSELE
jgi:hypothetical protein